VPKIFIRLSPEVLWERRYGHSIRLISLQRNDMVQPLLNVIFYIDLGRKLYLLLISNFKIMQFNILRKESLSVKNCVNKICTLIYFTSFAFAKISWNSMQKSREVIWKLLNINFHIIISQCWEPGQGFTKLLMQIRKMFCNFKVLLCSSHS